MNANTRDRLQISNFHAILLADTTVYTSNIVLSPVDTADAGKHKLCDGVQTYAQLPFIEDGGGGGSGITQLTGDVTAGPGTGSQVATIGANKVTTVKILDANVTLAKLADVATPSVLGRVTPGVGPVSALIPSEGRLALEFPENFGTPGQLLGLNDGGTAYEERTAAQVRAAAEAASRHYLNGTAQTVLVTVTGTCNVSAQLTVNLSVANGSRPAMATASVIGGCAGTGQNTAIVAYPIDETIGAFIVEFFDASTAQLAQDGTAVRFTVIGTLA